MKAIGDKSLASFIRVVLDASWWLVVIALTLLGGLFVVSFFIELKGDNLTMSLPVAIELNVPVVRGETAPHAGAQMEILRGSLKFPVRNGAFFSGSLLLTLALGAALLWIVTQLRHIFRSLSQGLLFIPENAQRLRWVGFALVIGEFSRAAIVYYWSYYTSLHFTANGIRSVPSTDLNTVTIIGGLAIVVIAEVFREGTRLHNEQSLTI